MDQSELEQIFKRLLAASREEAYPTYRQRCHHLRQLSLLLRENRDAIVAAISQDFGYRSVHESLIA